MSEYFDISPLVSEKTAVFPGDQSFHRHVALSFTDGHLELSHVTTTVHIGAHADAPSHYRSGAPSIEARGLHYYLGRCQVIRVKVDPGARVYPKDLADQSISAPRVLIATESFTDPNIWRSDFNSLSPELIQWLKARGVVTVGIDTPSIDPAEAKQLESHQAVAKADMAVLEGLNLSQVPQGTYRLIALPLRWEGVEASPVRAILLKSSHVLDE